MIMDSQANHPKRKVGRSDHGNRVTGYQPYSTGDAGPMFDDDPFGGGAKAPKAPERGPAGPLGRLVNKGLDALGTPESEGRVGKVSRSDKKAYKQNLKTYKANQGN
jgi:hypothetical protein